MAMDYKSFGAHFEVDDGFNCPFCGRKIERLNILFAKYSPRGKEIFFGYGCCDDADDSLWELPADTAFSFATLPAVLEAMHDALETTARQLDERRRG